MNAELLKARKRILESGRKKYERRNRMGASQRRTRENHGDAKTRRIDFLPFRARVSVSVSRWFKMLFCIWMSHQVKDLCRNSTDVNVSARLRCGFHPPDRILFGRAGHDGNYLLRWHWANAFGLAQGLIPVLRQQSPAGYFIAFVHASIQASRFFAISS